MVRGTKSQAYNGELCDMIRSSLSEGILGLWSQATARAGLYQSSCNKLKPLRRDLCLTQMIWVPKRCNPGGYLDWQDYIQELCDLGLDTDIPGL